MVDVGCSYNLRHGVQFMSLGDCFQTVHRSLFAAVSAL